MSEQAFESNVKGFELDDLEESVNNDDRDFNRTASQPDLMQDEVWVNPDAWDLAQLIKVYEQFEKEALFGHKPKIQYRCSRGHHLHNPTLLHKGRILLQEMN